MLKDLFKVYFIRLHIIDVINVIIICAVLILIIILTMDILRDKYTTLK